MFQNNCGIEQLLTRGFELSGKPLNHLQCNTIEDLI